MGVWEMKLSGLWSTASISGWKLPRICCVAHCMAALSRQVISVGKQNAGMALACTVVFWLGTSPPPACVPFGAGHPGKDGETAKACPGTERACMLMACPGMPSRSHMPMSARITRPIRREDRWVVGLSPPLGGSPPRKEASVMSCVLCLRTGRNALIRVSPSSSLSQMHTSVSCKCSRARGENRSKNRPVGGHRVAQFVGRSSPRQCSHQERIRPHAR